MLEQIIDIVRRAGDIVLSAHDIQNVTREKHGPADLVTQYDEAVQVFLRQELLKLLPEAEFFGEEGERPALTHPWIFVVDPIDGTTNFTRRMNCSSVSVALVHNGQTEYGVVYNPFVGELFAAQRGCGATLNGAPIRASSRDAAHAIVACGSTIYDRSYTDRHFAILRHLYDRCLDYRRFASAALDCCMVACGRAEIFFECRLSPWDYAAGSLIAQERPEASPSGWTAPSWIPCARARCSSPTPPAGKCGRACRNKKKISKGFGPLRFFYGIQFFSWPYRAALK